MQWRPLRAGLHIGSGLLPALTTRRLQAPSQTCAPAYPAGTCTPSVRKLRPICRAIISDQEMGMLAARAVIGAAAQMTCKDHRLGRVDCAHSTSHKLSKKLRCAAHSIATLSSAKAPRASFKKKSHFHRARLKIAKIRQLIYNFFSLMYVLLWLSG